MVRIDEYISRAVCLLRDTFADRLLYVGLQGSYSRGEADENSDIDLMVVLDELTAGDLEVYRGLLAQLGEAEKSCGLYHALCHRAVHAADGWDADGLRDAYKPVLYILQNRVYLETGVYWKTRRELLAHLDGINAEVLQTAAALKAGDTMDAGEAFRLLFTWCQTTLQNI